MDPRLDIESMNLLTDRLDAESLDGDLKEAVEGLNAALDRIAAVIDEHRKQEERARIVKNGKQRIDDAGTPGV